MTNHDVCGDNRFELIEKYKNKLLDGTNIDKSKDEMAVIDSILFRFWQMRWLDKLEQFDRQKAEIERLQKHTKEGIVLARQLPELASAIQAEAIKEFAERLKDKHKHNTTSVVSLVTVFDNINTLVKEMVGGGV